MQIILLDSMTLGDFDERIFTQFGDFRAYSTTDSTQIVERASKADIIITNKVVLDSKILSMLPSLKLICITATGTNNIDMDYAKAHNIVVKNVAGYSTHAVAQHTLMLALALLARLPYYANYVAKGQWCDSEIFCHLSYDLQDIRGKQWGIIGYGSIGKQVCKLAKAFEVQVSYHSASGNNTQNDIPHKSLEELLSTSDIISIHAPLSKVTHNLICKEQLALLKQNAILLNLGRGGIVNENDLAAMLHAKDFLFGADVLEHEPMMANHPLLDSKIAHKIIITPHIAWAYKDTKEKLLQMVSDNIRQFLYTDKSGK